MDAKAALFRIILPEEKIHNISLKIQRKMITKRIRNIAAKNVQNLQKKAKDVFANCIKTEEKGFYPVVDAKIVDVMGATTTNTQIPLIQVLQEADLNKVLVSAEFMMSLITISTTSIDL